MHQCGKHVSFDHECHMCPENKEKYVTSNKLQRFDVESRMTFGFTPHAIFGNLSFTYVTNLFILRRLRNRQAFQLLSAVFPLICKCGWNYYFVGVQVAQVASLCIHLLGHGPTSNGNCIKEQTLCFAVNTVLRFFKIFLANLTDSMPNHPKIPLHSTKSIPLCQVTSCARL